MSLFKKISSITAIAILASSTLFSPLGINSASANSSEKNGKEELKFELSPLGRYDVTFKDKGEGKSDLNAMKKSRDLQGGVKVVSEYKYSPKTVTVEMNEKAIKALAKNPNVVKIEPDKILELSATYSEPYHNNASWVNEDTGARMAYKEGYSGQGVKVAVLDSGVDTDNPMLTHAIKGGTSVVDWSSNYEDSTGHGTAVAGVVASKHQGNPYGIAPDVDLYAVKITNSATDGNASIYTVARGIEWAIDNDMDVINVSFGSYPNNDAYKNASLRAKSLGIPIFNSAGNEFQNLDNISDVRCLDIYNTYCVSALSKTDVLAPFSMYGRTVTFSAYGHNIPVVNVGSATPSVGSGTSYASPMAMGIFSLYKSKYPSMSSEAIIKMMKDNSVDISRHTPNRPVANAVVYKGELAKQPVAPLAPNIQVIKSDDKEITLEIAVPDNSTRFNKVEFDYHWVDGVSNKVVTIDGNTRRHLVKVAVPEYSTTYKLDAKVYNGSLSSEKSNTTSIRSQYQGKLSIPTLSIVSKNGREVTIRASVPSTSGKFNKLSFDTEWLNGDKIEEVTMPDTHTYDYTITLPWYAHTYRIDARAFNDDDSSMTSSDKLYFETDKDISIPPSAPTLSLLSVNGKTAKFRATVPNASTTFNKLELDYSWMVWSERDVVLNMDNTRSYEFTVEAPDYNTTYTIKTTAYNETKVSGFSNTVSFTTGSDNPIVAPATPTLSVISTNGKTVTLRASVPSTSAPFNKLSIDHRWVDGAYEIVTMPDTRSYDFTFTAPDFNTQYSTDVRAYNGDMSSGWSNVLSYTTGADNTIIAPKKPTLSLVSVNGKVATIKVEVPNDSATFNKLRLDYFWTSTQEITTSNTRSYTINVEAPAYNTTYYMDAKVFNGNVASESSNIFSFKTGQEPVTPIAPATPTLSLVSVNGKTVTVRATVPSSSATFNKLQFDYYWVAGTSDKVVTLNNTRTYDLTFEAPDYNTSYQIDAKAFNGEMSSGWSSKLSFTTGSGGSNNTILEDFSDNTFNFNFTGNWYRDITTNTFRSAVLPDSGGTTTSTFTVDAGSNGGVLSIDYKTSTEPLYDNMEIKVDGYTRLKKNGVMSNFDTFNTNLSAGIHTITLQYSNDGKSLWGEDAVFVDNIKVTKN